MREWGRGWRGGRRGAVIASVLAPLSEVDAATLEVVEVDARGRRTAIPRWHDDDGPREVPYAAGARDPGSLAGVWEGLARS